MDSQVLLRAFWIVMAFVVVSVFIVQINNLKETKILEADFISEDLSFLLSRISAIEGEVVVRYPLPEETTVRIEGNKVIAKYKLDESEHDFAGDSKKIFLDYKKRELIIRKNE